MTATAQSKFIFRSNTPNHISKAATRRTSSSTESEKDESKKTQENVPHQVTLHLVAEPGCSCDVASAYRDVTSRVGRSDQLILVSERQRPTVVDRSPVDRGGNDQTSQPKVPAIAVVLFCYDELDRHETNFRRDDDEIGGCETATTRPSPGTFSKTRAALLRRPWRYHHKVALSGTVMLCDDNVQDFYQYAPGDDEVAPPPPPSFPLVAVRKIHAGSALARVTIFASDARWRDQVAFYSLLLGRDAVAVRDDFCYFPLATTGDDDDDDVVAQVGLKRLPGGLRPAALTGAFAQFRVAGDVRGRPAPRVPYACEAISDRRWRTHDHDRNVLILAVVADPRRHRRSAADVGRRRTAESRSNRSVSSDGSGSSSSRSGARMKANLLGAVGAGNVLASDGSDQLGTTLGESFVCPSLPERMPLLKSEWYCSLPGKRRLESLNCDRGDSPSPLRFVAPAAWAPKGVGDDDSASKRDNKQVHRSKSPVKELRSGFYV